MTGAVARLRERLEGEDGPVLDAWILGDDAPRVLRALFETGALALTDPVVSSGPDSLALGGRLVLPDGPPGAVAPRFDAVFRDAQEGAGLEFRAVVANLPRAALARLFPGPGLPPWLSVDAPRLVISSAAGTIEQGPLSLPVAPGVGFVAAASLGDDVRAALGGSDVRAVYGPVRVGEDGVPRVALVTAPPFRLDLGVLALEDCFLGFRAVEDGLDPGEVGDAEPEDDEALGDAWWMEDEEAPEGDAPEDGARMLAGVGGRAAIGGGSALLWSVLDRTPGDLSFVLASRTEAEPAGTIFDREGVQPGEISVDDVTALAPLAGGATDWIDAFGHPRLLRSGGPLLLDALSVTWSAAAGVVVLASWRLRASRPLEIRGVDGAALDPFTVAWSVAFPGGGGERSVEAAAGGVLDAAGLQFQAALSLPDLRLMASAERGAVDFLQLRARPFMRALAPVTRARAGSALTEVFLEIACEERDGALLGTLTAAVATGPDGDEEVWEPAAQAG